MTELDSRAVLRRFLVLRASRWLPTGLLIPVLILLLVDRGLTLTEIGFAVAAQGVVVVLLELPTGGLADAVGRRRVLLLANVFNLVALGMIIAGQSLAWFVVAFALEGVFRALESGPLEAWYIDGVYAIDPNADVERGLSLGGVVIGVALGAGSLLSGVIVAWDPIPSVGALAAPITVAFVLRLLDVIAVYLLMTEVARPRGWAALRHSVLEVPTIIKGAFALVLSTASLAILMVVEITWGLSAASWEGLFPVRLQEVLGDPTRAATLMGPAAAGAWLVSAVGSSITPWLTKTFGQYQAAAFLKLIQALTLVGMGLVMGPIGLISVYLLCYFAFGASIPLHSTLVHAHASSSNRATVASLNSMAGLSAGAIGGILLGYVADEVSVSTGMLVAAVILAAGAPLYLAAMKKRELIETTPSAVSGA